MTDQAVEFRAASAAAATDGRTLSVRAVPFGRAVQLRAGLHEQFEPDAFRAQVGAAHRILFRAGHPIERGGKVIDDPERVLGRVRAMSPAPDGLDVEIQMADTSRGRDALAQIRDGIVEQVSVGFVPVETRKDKIEGGTLLTRVSARLDHLALVEAGAYGDEATVTAIRDINGGAMSLDDLRRVIDELDRPR
jgi:HK97 family phage prohead protease